MIRICHEPHSLQIPRLLVRLIFTNLRNVLSAPGFVVCPEILINHLICSWQVVSFLSTKDIPGTIADLKQAAADNSLAKDLSTIGLTLVSSDAVEAVRPVRNLYCILIGSDAVQVIYPVRTFFLHPHTSSSVGSIVGTSTHWVPRYQVLILD